MNTDQIRSFLTAAQLLSFTKAADRLFITQSALSRQIQALEQELNTSLFNTVNLTSAGRVLQKGLAAIYEDYTGLLVQVDNVSRGVEGELKIGLLVDQSLDEPVSFAIQHLTRTAPAVKLFMERVDFRSIYAGLKDGNLDMAVTLFQNDREDPEFCRFVYAMEEMCLAVHKNLLPSPNTVITEAEIPGILDKIPVTVLHPDNFIASIQDDMWNMLENGSVRSGVNLATQGSSIPILVSAGVCATPVNRSHILSIDPNIRLLEMKSARAVAKGIVWSRANPNPLLDGFITDIRKWADNINKKAPIIDITPKPKT